jgi:hypothetical protein
MTTPTINTSSVLTFIFWALAIYIIFQLIVNVFSRNDVSAESTALLMYSRTIDFILIGGLIALCLYGYSQLAPTDQQNLFGFMLNWTYEFFNDPYTFLECIIFTVVFFVLVYLLQVPMQPELRPFTVRLLEHKVWIIFAMFIVIFFFKYALGIPILDILFNNPFMYWLENLGSPTPAPTTTGTPSSTPTPLPNALQNFWNWITNQTIPPKPNTATPTANPTATPTATPTANPTANPTATPTATVGSGSVNPPKYDACGNLLEVYNIGNNIYTYNEAQAICKAFNSDLANYDQIEGAYNAGGEWCNYGWSKGQMAYFPTQKDTWNKLQKDPITKNACGRPGINGGFIKNPNVRFGANCYGVKPPKPDGWKPNFATPNATLKPAVATTKPIDKRIQKMKDAAIINAFNQPNGEWSEYFGVQTAKK